MLKKRKKIISFALVLAMVFSMKIGCLAEPVTEGAVENTVAAQLSAAEAASEEAVGEAVQEIVGEAAEELPAGNGEEAELPEEEADGLKEETETAELPAEVGDHPEEVPDGATQLDAPAHVYIMSSNGIVNVSTVSNPSYVQVKPGYVVFEKVRGTLDYSVLVRYDSTGKHFNVHVPDDNPGRVVCEDFTYDNTLTPTASYDLWVEVTAKGDGTSYSDSYAASSEHWTYQVPQTRYAPPSDVSTTPSTYAISWTHSGAPRYRVMLEFSGMGGIPDTRYENVSITPNAQGKCEYYIDPLLIEEERQKGATGVRVGVYALSDNINEIYPSMVQTYVSRSLSAFPAYDPNALTGISFKENPIRIGLSRPVEVGLVFTPENATNKNVRWESQNPSIASVDNNGNLVGYSVGSTWITARSVANPTVTASCNVIVSQIAPDSVSVGSVGKWSSWELLKNGTLIINCDEKSLSASTPPWQEYLDQITALELRGPVMTVRGSMFYNMPVLQSVSLPYAMSMKIQNNAGLFYNCPMLERISMSESGGGLEVISNNLVVQEQKRGATVVIGLKTATEIPDGIQSIGSKAFFGQSLPYIKLPASISRVEANAFAGCKQLSFVVIENKKCTIMGNAFADCKNLKDVYFAGNEREWKKICKDKVLKNATVHCEESMPELCRVTYDAMGGNPVSNQVVIKGRTIEELPVSYHSQNKVQDGWYLDSGCTQKFEEKSTVVDRNITLYAKWRDAVPYRVVLYSRKNADGSWIRLSEQTVYEQNFISAPQMKGNGDESFVGWYIDENLIKGFNIRSRVTSNLNLYARWTTLTVEKRTGMLTDDVEISYELEYTDETEYDGRSHVVSEVAGKATVSNAAVNPDIKAENFRVIVNGAVVPGITVTKFTYENNRLPSNDGMSVKPMMYIYPVIKYDKNDSDLQDLLRQYPTLKTVLKKMLKPTYDKKAGEWNYEPLSVNIRRLELSSGTEVYTKKQLREDPELRTKDGILVWNGGKVRYTYKKVGRGEDAESYLLKKVVPGLYYQSSFRLANGKTVVKKLTLRAGGWSLVTRRDEEDEIERELKMNSKNMDYYVEEGGDSLVLNSSPWMTETDDGVEKCRIKAGYFDGSLPSIESEEPVE